MHFMTDITHKYKAIKRISRGLCCATRSMLAAWLVSINMFAYHYCALRSNSRHLQSLLS